MAVVGVFAPRATAQQFQKTYDDAFTYASVSQSVRQTVDGGYITVGYSYYWSGALNVLLSKTTSTGALVWTKELIMSNQPGTPTAMGLAVREIVDKGQTSGYVIVGTTREVSGTNDVLVIRTNGSGFQLWRNTYQGSGEDVAYNVEVIPDQSDPRKKNFVLTGYSGAQEVPYGVGLSAHKGQKVFLARLTDNGGILWWNHYGVAFPTDPAKEEWAAGYDVEYLSNGDLAVTGFVDPTGRVNGYDKVPFVLRTTGGGTLLWATQYLGQLDPYSGLDRYAVGKAIRETSDGGFIVTGIIMDYPPVVGAPGPGLDVFLLKLTSSGVVSWMYAYNTMFDGSNYNEGGYDVHQSSDGNYVVVGRTNYLEGSNRTMMIKVSSNGQLILWTNKYTMRVIGEPYTVINNTDVDEMGISMHACSNGGYIIESKPYPNSPNGFYLLRTDASGRTLGCEEPFLMDVTPLHPSPVAMDELSESTTFIPITPETDPKDYTEESCGAMKRAAPGEENDLSQKVLIHPNVLKVGSPLQIRCAADPGSPVTVTVADVLGRTIYSGDPVAVTPGESISIGTGEWGAGTYFVRIVSENYTETRSIVVE